MSTPIYPCLFSERVPTCVIVGAGAFAGMDYVPDGNDLVLAADGGYARLKALGVRCDLLIGDLDSLSSDVSIDTDTRRYNPIKDDTDTMLAVKYGMEHGFRRFFLYGVFGGRFDHTAATLQTVLWLAGQGAQVLAFEAKDNGTAGAYVTAVKDGTLTFPPEASGYLSVFALGGEAHGVTLENLKYPLANAVLVPDFPLGVSNEFLPGKPAKITVTNGTLVVIKPQN